MTVDIEISCPELPKIPKIPDINILGLAQLKGMLDFSVGSPSQCTLGISLMLQIAPLLASMTCLLKILAVFKAMESFVKSPLTETTELLEKLADLAPCFGALSLPSISITLKGILELVIGFFVCFIDQLESLISFQASIDLSAGEGNPVLEASLECARDNVATSMDNLMLSLEAIQPLMDMTKSVGGVVGIDLDLPDLAGVSVKEDASKTIADLKGAIEKMQQTIESLPG